MDATVVNEKCDVFYDVEVLTKGKIQLIFI